MNIADGLTQARHLFPQKTALIYDDTFLTYSQLDTLSNRLANVLVSLDLKRGDRLALLLPNSSHFVQAFYGILKMGAVAVCINPALKAEEVKFILQDSQSKVVITTAALRDNILSQSWPELQHILIAEGEAPAQTHALDTLITSSDPEFTPLNMEPDEPAEILYTSGTSGSSKGATHSHRNVIFSMRTAMYTYRLQPDDCVQLFLPAFHCFGLHAALSPCIAACATLVLQREFDLQSVLAAATKHQVTMLFAVPTIFTLLLEQAHPEQLRSVRFYLSAAANLPLEISRRWREKFGLDIGEGYGLTECFLVTYNHYLKYKPSSVGTPLEGIELKIVDENDQSLPAGKLGEVVISGPNVMLNYWNRPTETAETISQGWFHTGDIGYMDEDGYFYIVDRIKDMINVGGLKVYPSEVENVLYQHPAILEAAVFGTTDAVLGEQVAAALILQPDQSLTSEAVMAYCRDRLADFKIPTTIEFVTKLPKSRTGKILKRVLRDEANHPSSPADKQTITGRPDFQVTSETVKAWIVEWLVGTQGVDRQMIDFDCPFADYGLTSASALTLLRDLGDWLGKPIEPVMAWQQPTITALAHHLVNDHLSFTTLAGLEILPEKAEQTTEQPSDLDDYSEAELADILAAEIALSKRQGAS